MVPSQISPVDRLARRARWTRHLVDGEFEEIRATFVAAGAAAPTISWRPDADLLQTEPCRFLHRYWLDRRGGSEVPAISAISPPEMKAALGYVLLVEPVDGGEDFRYRVYGSLVATISDIDLTGRRMTDHHASDYVVDFAVASARAGRQRREPLYTVRHPARSEFTKSWERIQLPLAGPSGSIDRLLIGNVPVSRDGEILRPAF